MLHIAQDYEYQGSDYWKWSVWIDGTDEELDKIESVEYTLHPTFPNPVRVVDGRATKFRLDSAGVGQVSSVRLGEAQGRPRGRPRARPDAPTGRTGAAAGQTRGRGARAARPRSGRRCRRPGRRVL